MKNEKGITLIILVITIIVISIISGVTIYTVISDEGLLASGEQLIKENALKELKENIKNDLVKKSAQVKQAYQRELDINDINSIIENNGCSYDEPTDTIMVLKGDASTEIFLLSEIWNVNSVTRIKSNKVSDLFNKTIKKGEYISYTPEADTSVTIEATYSGVSTAQTITRDNLLWRVLDIQDGKMRLISETSTTQVLELQGANGYNNAVYQSNNTCEKLYSGTMGTAKSIQIEDFQDKMDLDVWDYKTYGSSVTYGSTYPSTGKYYPYISQDENYVTVDGVKGSKYTINDTSKQDAYIKYYYGSLTASSTLVVTQTYWYKTLATNNFIDENDFYLLISDPTLGQYPDYTIASRIITIQSGTVSFGVSYKLSTGTGFGTLYTTTGSGYNFKKPLRPIVTLNDNIELNIDDQGEGTKTNPWKIKIGQ